MVTIRVRARFSVSFLPRATSNSRTRLVINLT
jgi:hypothetical protein